MLHVAYHPKGPKRQDAEEIKARARLAKQKSKVGEVCERIYLAFSRIDLRQKSCKVLTDQDEEYIDMQFLAMVEHLKKLMNEGADDSHGISPTFREERAPDYNKMDEMFRLVLASARSIASRRLSIANIESSIFSNPYGTIVEGMSADDPKRVTVYLENLQATLMAAKKSYDSTDQKSVSLRSELDRTAITLGKRIVSITRNLSDVAHSKTSKRIRSESTLFPDKEYPESDNMDSLISDVCECFTKALSLYQGIEECSEQTIEWCEILVEIMQQSRQTTFPKKKGDAYHGRNHSIIAGIMAIKAYAESTNGSYGSALKTARSAWETDGSDLGCLTTLFYCSMRHELFSYSDIKTGKEKTPYYSFSNTFLELDHALDVYLSLSKLETSNVTQSLQSLLTPFPVMCKLAMGHEILIIGLQRRMIKLTIEIASTLMSSDNLELFAGEKKTFTLFDLICSYLASFDDMLPQCIEGEHYQISEELICLQHIIDPTLNLLIKIRGISNKKRYEAEDIAFHDMPSFLNDSMLDDVPCSDEPRSLYDTTFVKSYIGGQNQCLWIGKSFHDINCSH